MASGRMHLHSQLLQDLTEFSKADAGRGSCCCCVGATPRWRLHQAVGHVLLPHKACEPGKQPDVTQPGSPNQLLAQQLDSGHHWQFAATAAAAAAASAGCLLPSCCELLLLCCGLMQSCLCREVNEQGLHSRRQLLRGCGLLCCSSSQDGGRQLCVHQVVRRGSSCCLAAIAAAAVAAHTAWCC
jgi:hypothetical protein